ncbi:HEAT repeat domain-containing protein [Singulisphaera sp. Ch08]|uniref:HEAT repeat domain-containing protein n=1 Tax=Singulisphaera sp. Ch08 TaxID=3120278 RepID=A0AAU7CK19_9BACT
MTILSYHKVLAVRPDSSGGPSTPGRSGSIGTRAALLGLIVVLVASLQPGPDVGADETAGGARAVERWVDALKGQDPKARAEAAQALGLMGPPAKAAAPALVEALGDRDVRVRVRAASALARIGGPLKLALPVLLEARNVDDDQVRGDAESAWEQISPGIRATVRSMPDLPQRNNVQGHRKVVVALAKHGLNAVPSLVDALELEHTSRSGSGIPLTPAPGFNSFSPFSVNNSARLQTNTQVRAVAIEALGKQGPDVLPTLLAALQDRNPSVREGATQALGLLKPLEQAAISALVRALQDRDAWVRQEAVEALAKAGKSSPVALAALGEALGHKDTMVRRAVVQTLAPTRGDPSETTYFGSGMMVMTKMAALPVNPAIPPLGASLGLIQPSIVPALIAALDDPDSYVRLKAAEALARVSPPVQGSLPALLSHLTDRDESSRQMAGHSLESLGPRAREIAPALRELLSAKAPAVRISAARVLARVDPEAKAVALQTLREVLDDDEKETVSQLKAAESLWDLGHADVAIPVLVTALSDGNGSSNVSNQARQILQRIGPANKEAIPALLEALKEASPNTGSQVLQILQRLGSAARDAAPDLIALTTSKNFNLREQVLQTLRQLGPLPKKVVPQILAAIKESDPNFRSQLIPLLGQLGTESKATIPALVAMLKEPAQNVRLQVLQVLQQIAPQAPKETATALVEAVKGKDANVSTQATRMLEQLGANGETTATAVVELLKDPLPANRLQATRILSQIGPAAKSATPALIDALRDKDNSVRAGAVQALGKMGPEVVAGLASSLKELLEDADPTVRINALTILTTNLGSKATISDPSYLEFAKVPELNLGEAPIELSDDSHPDVRLQAIQTLVRLGRDRAIVAALMDRLDDSDRLVRLRAAQALAFAPDGSDEAKAGLRVLVSLLKENHPDIRSQAAGTLGHLGTRASAEIPALTERLKDSELAVRYQVALALCQMGTVGRKTATPVLIEAAKQGEPSVRLGAITALRRMGAAESKLTLATLLDLLRSSDFSLSSQAGDLLAQLGPLANAAIPELTEMLKDENPSFRSQAARVLSRLGPAGTKAAASPLVQMLGEDDANSRNQAIGMIQSLSGADLSPAVPFLIEMIGTSDQNAQSQAAQALGQIGPASKAAIPALREMLENAQSVYRLQAAQAIVRITPGQDEPFLLDILVGLLHDSQAYVRLQAANTLIQMGPAGFKRGLPSLLEMLQSSQPSSYYPSLQSLGQLRGAEAKQVVPTLIALLDYPDATLRNQAANTLGQIGAEAKPAIPALAAQLAKTSDPSFGPTLARTLGLLGSESVPALTAALKTTTGTTQILVIHTLGRIGPAAGPAAPALIDLLGNDDASLRAAAFTSLTAIGLDAVAPLAARLGDDDAPGRLLVVKCLGRLGSGAKEAVPALTLALKDKEPLVRAAAAGSLDLIDGDRQSAIIGPVLAACLTDDNVSVRRAAVAVLARLDPLPPALVPDLAAALKNEDGLTRLHAATALARLPEQSDQAVAALADLLDDPLVRLRSLAALDQLGPAAKGAAPRLIERLNEANDGPTAGKIASTLARIAGNSAVDPLLKTYAESDLGYQPTIIAALSQTGAAGVAPLTRMLADGKAEIREQAVRSLGTIAQDVEAARPALQEALNDKEPAVRVEAAIGLAKLGGETGASALPTLLATAKAHSDPDRLRAIEALGNLGPAAVPTLTLALKERGLVRLRAAEALGRIGSPAEKAGPDLEQVLNDPNPQTQARAAIALWEVAGDAKAAVPVLIEALRTPALRPPILPNTLASSLRSFTFDVTTTVWTNPGQAALLPVPPLLRLEIIQALGRMKSQASEAVPALREATKEASPALRQAAAEAIKTIEPAGTTGQEVR